MSGLLSSVRWAAVAQVSRVGGQLISLAVLSRLLPPADYGVMAMAGVVTALAGMLRDMGTGAAIIQRKELGPELTHTVFWMNMVLGVSLALALALSSPALGRFFREPQLPGVLLVLAVLFPIGSATAVHQALIERRSGFKTLAALDVVNQVVGLALAIAAALAGAGVYSFVVPVASSTLISSIWLFRQSRYVPRWMWSASEFKGLWGFSGNLTAFNFINYFARNADSMIIGRILGSVALGNYSMAYKVMLFPVQNLSWTINRVLLPKLSELQDDPTRTRELYLRVLGSIVTLSAPLMAGLWVLREPFVLVAFGPNWQVVHTLLAWLAPVGFLQSMMSTIGPLFTARGQTQRLMWLGVANTMVYIAAFFIGARFGLVAVAMAYLVANTINFFTVVIMTKSLLSAQTAELLGVVFPAAVSAFIMACGIAAEQILMNRYSVPTAFNLIFSILSGMIFYQLSFWYFFKKSPLHTLKTFASGK